MPFDPTTGKRPKTGGRKKGTPNKVTLSVRSSLLQVFTDLQAEAGGENRHFLDWARDNPGDFYKLFSRLLPRERIVAEDHSPITEVKWTIVRPGDPPTRPSGVYEI